MDLLAGVLLFVLPELDAFFSMQALLQRVVPQHFVACARGAALAAQYVDDVLAAVDPELRAHLHSQVG